MEAIWQEQINVQAYEVDMFNNLKLSSLFNYCQAAAGHHAAALNVEDQALYQQNLTWVILRMNLEMFRYPGRAERLTLVTWLEDASRLYGIRHFILYDHKHSVVAQCSSAWVLLDLVKRQIKRLRSLRLHFPEVPAKWRGLGKMPKKVELADSLNSLEYREIIPKYSDIDINQHVNNARYVDWICDSFAPEYLKGHKIQLLKVDYLHEIKLQQAVGLQVYKGQDEQKNFIEAIAEDGQKSFQAEIKWF